MQRTRSRYGPWVEVILLLLLPALTMAASELLCAPVPVFSWSSAAAHAEPISRQPAAPPDGPSMAFNMPHATVEGSGGNTVFLSPDMP